MRSQGRRRSVLDFSGSQAEAITMGGVAGNDYIANNLADLPPGLARVLADSHEHGQLMVTSLERLSEQLNRAIDRVRDDLDIYRATEASERAARRREFDAQVASIAARADAAAYAAQEAAQRTEILAVRATAALGILATVVLMAVLVLSALVYDRLALLTGLALSSLYARLRAR